MKDNDNQNSNCEYQLFYTVDLPYRVIALRTVEASNGRNVHIDRDGKCYPHFMVRPLGLSVVPR